MKKLVLVAVGASFATSAMAQTNTIDPQGTTTTTTVPGSAGVSTLAPGVSSGSPANAGQLDFGRSSSSGIGTAGAPASGAATASPGQLELGRTPSSGGGGMPSVGAGIGSSGAGVPMTDDVYTRPIYGR